MNRVQKLYTQARTTLAGARAFVRLVRDPHELDAVFSVADSMVQPEIVAPILAAFRETDYGAKAVEHRTRVGRVDVHALAAMPEGTLGQVFGQHMIDNELNPEDLPTLASPDEQEYVRAHLYETHDIWHVVTGFGTDVKGELGLQAFYLAQFPARLAAALLAAAMLNTFLYAFEERDGRMQSITEGWQVGKQTRSLLGIDWAAMWDRPLADIRAELGITLTPMAQVAAA